MLNVPDELEFLDFFGSEPVESAPEDGYFCYKAVNERGGIELFFSFHEIEGSIQSRLVLNNEELMVVSGECVEEIRMQRDASGEYLSCLFNVTGVESKASVYIRPRLKIKWHMIQK
ncbi:MAG: hypothetical protein GKR94_32840 [Gammaproteobacteria bacterium]|nr:hypothetical protein [Gammaproteobacteria bacterium]